MRIVIALGGNALLRRGEPLDAAHQRANAARAADALARVAVEHELVVTHGNGPQVGLLALQSAASADVDPYPLDVLGAETEGMIGYLLEQELSNRLPHRDVVALLTRVIVDRADPAFERPSKPVGPVYDETEARRLANQRGWTVAADGDGWRRVVASPEPKAIVELATIARLTDAGALVIAAGGGGIPVTPEDDGTLAGVEAVVDKDLTAALLADRLDADALILATDVSAVAVDWRTPASRDIRRASPQHLRALRFAPGSMGPKVDAVCRFVDNGGRWAAIGALDDLDAVVAGRAGTHVVAGPGPLTYYTRPGALVAG